MNTPKSVPQAKMFLPGDNPAALLSSPAVYLHPAQGRPFSIKPFRIKKKTPRFDYYQGEEKEWGAGEFRQDSAFFKMKGGLGQTMVRVIKQCVSLFL